jgi:hypothetical protein
MRSGAGVTQADHQSAKKWRFGRVLVIYLVVGAVFGCLSAALKHATGLTEGVAGGGVCGGLVLVAPMLNRLVGSGNVPWLLKE